jgi:hypothetical protein
MAISIVSPHRLHQGCAACRFDGRMVTHRKELEMSLTRKHTLIALGAAAAVFALAGTAIAAGPPKTPPRLAGAPAAQGYGVMAGGAVMDAAAEYIGISETALATARHSGKSLAQIAVDNGKTAAGLQQAIVAAFKVNLDKAVAAGNMTEAQAAQVLATFQSRVQTLVDRTATGPMFGRGGGAGPGLGLRAGMCGGRR